MLDRQTEALLLRILEDAVVYDVDFSNWYREICLVAGADHFPSAGRRLALFRIAFTQPQEFHFLPLSEGEGPQGHPRWNTCGGTVRRSGRTLTVEVNGDEFTLGKRAPNPELTVVCRGIRVDTMSYDPLDSVRPGWDRPTGTTRDGLAFWDHGLVRPDLATLAQMCGTAHRRK